MSSLNYELAEIKGEKVKLHLHYGQTQAWDSEARFPFIIAGTQSGKTSFGPWWLHREIQRCGVGDYLAVTATYDLFKLKMLPELKKVFINIFGGWDYMAGERVLVNKAGDTRIILRSADAEGGLESATAKAAWVDECGQDKFRVGAWEAIQRRLSLEQGRCLGTTTPYNLGWLKTEVFDHWQDGDKDFNVFQFKSIMNPSFPRDEYFRMQQKLAFWKFNMFYNGAFSRPAGMIFSDFDFETQVIEDSYIPLKFPRYVGVDFGPVHNVILWFAHDTERDVFICYREKMEGDKTAAEHVRGMLNDEIIEIKKDKDGKEEIIKENVVARYGGSHGEDQYRRDWAAAGAVLREAQIVDVEAGIDRIIELMKTKRLLIFKSCKGLLGEIGIYARKLNEKGEPTDEIKDKSNFHHVDALRYFASRRTSPLIISGA